MTDELYSIRPLVAVLLPWISLLAILAISNSHRRLKKIVHVLGSLATFGVVFSLLPAILNGKTFGVNIISVMEQINIHLTVDTLGYYFGLVSSFIWLLATIYSTRYIDHNENRYYSFMAICNSFTIGAAFSQNMFTYFVFYEIMTLTVYPLIIHEETATARLAGTKYLIYTITAGAVLLFAILFQYFLGGDLSLVSYGTLGLETASRSALMVIFFAYFIGFGVKAAVVPLEGWVPDAHPAAPSPASALLSGIILKAGAFGLIRVVFNVFGLTLFKDLNLWIYLAVIASVTIVITSVRALMQDDLKRRLAYSSSSQVSYILLGLALLSYDSVLGGIIHIAHHALMKACMFFCVGIMFIKTGKKNVSDMAGMGYRLPLTMICFSICALAMMGTPLTVGFISKWLLGSGAIQANKPFFVIILLISALLNAAYFLPIIYTMFFKHSKDNEHAEVRFKGEVTPTMLWPTIVLASLVILAGIWDKIPGFPYSLVNKFVANLFH
jgi:multicomponent Na+:H+ antiporter subunit D